MGKGGSKRKRKERQRGEHVAGEGGRTEAKGGQVRSGIRRSMQRVAGIGEKEKVEKRRLSVGHKPLFNLKLGSSFIKEDSTILSA